MLAICAFKPCGCLSIVSAIEPDEKSTFEKEQKLREQGYSVARSEFGVAARWLRDQKDCTHGGIKLQKHDRDLKLAARQVQFAEKLSGRADSSCDVISLVRTPLSHENEQLRKRVKELEAEVASLKEQTSIRN